MDENYEKMTNEELLKIEKDVDNNLKEIDDVLNLILDIK